MSARGVLLVAALGLPGCFLDPTCKDSCDGTAIASCMWKCSGGGKLDIDECHRIYGGADCRLEKGPSGNPMTCRLQPVVGGEPAPYCIDVTLPRCDPKLSIQCSGLHASIACQATTEGGYAYPVAGDPCPQAGLACHAAGDGISCVDEPAVTCAPAVYPRCAGSALQFCLGRASAGWAVRTIACAPKTCAGPPGQAQCR